MSALSHVIASVARYNRFVDSQVRRARTHKPFARQLLRRFNALRSQIPTVTTPTGLEVPRLALPQTDDPAEIARYLFASGPPGEFPFVNGVYRQMYHDSAEEPTRLFAGLGLAEQTNQRFHYLRRHQSSVRLSTAFDGPTLYGLDSDQTGLLGKVGEGGVAVDSVDDMLRLYHGFDLGDDHFSASMTINGPAPIILAMYVAAARRRFGPSVTPRLRGTIQADILKEVQAQNEIIFPLDASLRFLADMAQYTTAHMPRWYPISISGYHIAEAGATPVQQAAYTLSNGFAYVELFKSRGMDVDLFGPRLSFFLDCALDLEYLALARVCRKIWAVGMRDAFAASPRAQTFKLHTQTSGRSLIAREFQNNLTRTAAELILAYLNSSNSTHSNSADEPFTTPSQRYVRLAAQSQAILLEESGLFKFMTNALSGSPGMAIVETAVESAVLAEMSRIEELGGVLGAIEHRYQRSQIQQAAHRYEQQIQTGIRPMIALNRYATAPDATDAPAPHVVRTPLKDQRLAAARSRDFKRRHAKDSPRALDALAKVVESRGNVFAELLHTVNHCTLGQITTRLHTLVGHYRPTV